MQCSVKTGVTNETERSGGFSLIANDRDHFHPAFSRSLTVARGGGGRVFFLGQHCAKIIT